MQGGGGPAFTFTFMHLADAFIQSDLKLHSGYTFSLVCVRGVATGVPGCAGATHSGSWHT